MALEIKDLREYIDKMQGMYDIVRLVEPASCNAVSLEPGDIKKEEEKCYATWGKCDRCTNCSSYQACVSNRVQEKTEIRDGIECRVISIPSPIIDNGIMKNTYCIELVSFGNKAGDMMDEDFYACVDSNEDALYVSIVGNKRVSDDIISLALLDSEIGIICLDEDENCIYSNKKAFKMFHIPNELRRMQDFLKSWITSNVEKRKESIWSQFFIYDGTEYLYELHMMPAVDSIKKKIIGTCIAVMDVTEEAVHTGGVKFRETHDVLTGIYNQEGFFKEVKEKLIETPDEEYYILCSNIKKFKLLNQLFGMEKGDEILKLIAHNIQKWCTADDVYARTHSDEFVLLMKKREFKTRVFEDGIKEISSMLDSSIYRLHFQIGVYEIKNPRESIYEMLDKARMAMETIFDNKEVSIAFFSEDIMSKFLRENEIINSFNIALEKGEFHIFLQPQVDYNGNIQGGEALARWINPEKGIVAPGTFIGVLENANLIYKMDRYVWELAARQICAWKGTDKENLRISVNISPKDLQFLDIEVVFTDLVEKYDIEPGKLNLEITETAVASNVGRCIELMSRLRQKGFLVEIDDFGSGYSSLNLLKDFEVDVLKIDMNFLSNTGSQKRTDIILEHVISMAQKLDMQVIAEGVETKQQLEMLNSIGCDFFQGYYFSKPVDVATFEKLRF